MEQVTFRVKQHFTSPQWVDLVRGQLTEQVASQMDEHLRAGCSECLASFDAWQGFAVFASEERLSAPPADAVRVAKSYLAQRKLIVPVGPALNSMASWASATLATLVFDSQQAAPAGVRAATIPSRHLVFDATSLVIDLHIEAASRPEGWVLVGQVVDRDQPDVPFEHIWLSLADERQEISTFQANELGEFHCTFHLRRALKLMVHAGPQVVAIPIETLFDASTDSEPTEH